MVSFFCCFVSLFCFMIALLLLNRVYDLMFVVMNTFMYDAQDLVEFIQGTNEYGLGGGCGIV